VRFLPCASKASFSTSSSTKMGGPSYAEHRVGKQQHIPRRFVILSEAKDLFFAETHCNRRQDPAN